MTVESTGAWSCVAETDHGNKTITIQIVVAPGKATVAV